MLKEKCELAYSRGIVHGYMFVLSRKKKRTGILGLGMSP
nr:MAG TPA: hypothetical protein [Caudoviricetes sp.]